MLALCGAWFMVCRFKVCHQHLSSVSLQRGALSQCSHRRWRLLDLFALCYQGHPSGLCQVSRLEMWNEGSEGRKTFIRTLSGHLKESPQHGCMFFWCFLTFLVFKFLDVTLNFWRSLKIQIAEALIEDPSERRTRVYGRGISTSYLASTGIEENKASIAQRCAIL